MGESVAAVIERLRGIDGELPTSDGAAVFNHIYLTVTEEVAAGLEHARVFHDPVFMAHLDVTFAGLWLEAYDASVAAVPKAWAALFERRVHPRERELDRQRRTIVCSPRARPRSGARSSPRPLRPLRRTSPQWRI